MTLMTPKRGMVSWVSEYLQYPQIQSRSKEHVTYHGSALAWKSILVNPENSGVVQRGTVGYIRSQGLRGLRPLDAFHEHPWEHSTDGRDNKIDTPLKPGSRRCQGQYTVPYSLSNTSCPYPRAQPLCRTLRSPNATLS